MSSTGKFDRRLTWTTVGFTYFLMFWGNLVSSTGSGLACPDWPLCRGTVTPPFIFAVILEWGHRLLAATTTVLIITTIYRTLRSSQSGPIRRSGRSLLALLGLQILLGGTTVLLGLSVAVSTIHLVVATLVFSGLIAVACVTTWGNPVVSQPSTKLRRFALAGLGGMIIQLVLGALVRHTHSGLACAYFPKCLGSFWPTPLFFGTAVAFLHRWWGFALLGIYAHVASYSKASSQLSRPARAAFGLALVQVCLGVATVLSRLDTHTRATHAAVGYALWGILFYVALRSGAFRWLWDRGEPKGAVAEPGPQDDMNPCPA